ncbi:MAG TPA: hypothetical protein VJT49_27700 [Amycolatopsis sp.]|uniref:DeoR/GlpR family DNA-binding transcription regulator n=1 Tax=Amycolatopsis sp. TaxID=37632 RepID=UPI002B48C7D4|nr:hypothetical protein [Amycolatopsis sp.]HKS48826.1 hypothetical protein [Amycolatopsis sp.]
MCTYGGAYHPGSIVEHTLAEKDAVAAAGLGRDGDVVLLDAGTTVGRLAARLPNRSGLTAVTNGSSALLALADSPEAGVIVLGGRLRYPNEAIVGSTAGQQLRSITPDVVFLGADGLVAGRGRCAPTLEQAQLKHVMLYAARTAVVLAGHSKLGASPFPYWAPLDRPYTPGRG